MVQKLRTDEVFIVAEIGLNHNGDLDQAKKMVQEVSKTGADAAKFQIYNTGEFLSENSRYYDDFAAREFTRNEWREIKDVTDENGLVFFSSVFDGDSVELLSELGAPIYKIASGDVTHIPLLRKVSEEEKPTIISTGMAKLGEIEQAIEMFERDNIHILHCISDYPAKIEDVNLRTIETLKKSFKVPVGFSDHTHGWAAPLAAVTLGADIIEKHFTLKGNIEGPDHELSLNPGEFKTMVQRIREIKQGLGTGEIKLTESEKESKPDIRRSIKARTKIPQGTIITEDNIKITRPENGIKPKYIDMILGRAIRKEIPADQPITWKHL